jgi:hypothetical protein
MKMWYDRADWLKATGEAAACGHAHASEAPPAAQTCMHLTPLLSPANRAFQAWPGTPLGTL